MSVYMIAYPDRVEFAVDLQQQIDHVEQIFGIRFWQQIDHFGWEIQPVAVFDHS